MDDDEAKRRKETCRILVVGARRDRVTKVVSLLTHTEDDRSPPSVAAFVDDDDAITAGLSGHLLEHARNDNVCVEYLPCVAKFGSYQDEKGNSVRYLVSVDYCDPALSTPSSLLKFFDEEDQDDERNKKLFPGVAGVAIGSGIDGDEDTARIRTFLETMISGGSSPVMPELRTLRPSPPYETMREELAAYKTLTAEEKEEATRQQSMGPGKMAKMASGLALELIHAALLEKYGESPAPPLEASETIGIPEQKSAPHVIDIGRTHFKCRKCRVTLFGQADLEDPPHQPSQHSFSYRKVHHGGTTGSSSCQSFFLQDTLDWMENEGKFSCPSCDTKLGSTTWSGTQCSCGTWVVPAIQIPKSKVDVIDPEASSSVFPPGTVGHRLNEVNLSTS